MITEAEWLTGEDARALLEHLRPRASRRKLRLFACAGCRWSGDGLEGARGRHALELAESFADATTFKLEMTTARSAARGLPRVAGHGLAWRAATMMAARLPARTPAAFLVREIFGNPFRSLALDSAWVTGTVETLAWAAHDERSLPGGTLDSVRLAVLADALEEAGCTESALLEHLRTPGPHFRGCWAVDLLLSKDR
jgi:hypothetical protein